MKKAKELKHYWTWNTGAGRLYRYLITYIGIKLMSAARKCFKRSLGRCSWCGRDCGMSGVLNEWGVRCMHKCEADKYGLPKL